MSIVWQESRRRQNSATLLVLDFEMSSKAAKKPASTRPAWLAAPATPHAANGVP
jgi:hypothetical protein